MYVHISSTRLSKVRERKFKRIIALKIRALPMYIKMFLSAPTLCIFVYKSNVKATYIFCFRVDGQSSQ